MVLKIPVFYLGFVVWWALRGEPDRGEPVHVAVVSDTPPDGPGIGMARRQARRPTPGRPHGRPVTGGRAARVARSTVSVARRPVSEHGGDQSLPADAR